LRIAASFSMSSGMSRNVTVAALQLALGGSEESNIAAVTALVREAAGQGAAIILPPELFEGPYFCRVEDEAEFARARPLGSHPSVTAMRALAAELGVTIPTSFFERDGPHYYNTLAMIGPDGGIMGTYRKSHIPDGPGYEEKFYFRPGNTGFKVWNVSSAPAREETNKDSSKSCTAGVGICWDQWYPECARAMALMGAELLLYPTAIGSEPHDPGLDTRRLWRRAMVGHAICNVTPVIAANRIGVEDGQRFYGTSFICDEWGDVIAELGDAEEGVITATLDLDRAAKNRAGMGFFRDRRPEFYRRLTEDV
jgi:N-carbamoylputrescine amidase